MNAYHICSNNKAVGLGDRQYPLKVRGSADFHDSFQTRSTPILSGLKTHATYIHSTNVLWYYSHYVWYVRYVLSFFLAEQQR